MATPHEADTSNGRTTNRDIWEKLEGMIESLAELKVRTEPLSGLPLLTLLVQKNTDELGRHHEKIVKLEEKVKGFELLLERFRGRTEAKMTLGKAGAFIGIVSALILGAAGVVELVKTFVG